jgi:hypothetical protein
MPSSHKLCELKKLRRRKVLKTQKTLEYVMASDLERDEAVLCNIAQYLYPHSLSGAEALKI